MKKNIEAGERGTTQAYIPAPDAKRYTFMNINIEIGQWIKETRRRAPKKASV